MELRYSQNELANLVTVLVNLVAGVLGAGSATPRERFSVGQEGMQPMHPGEDRGSRRVRTDAFADRKPWSLLSPICVG